jgi:thioester reductase-like protein
VRGVSFRTVSAETLDRLLATGGSGPLPAPAAAAANPRRAGVPRLVPARLRVATRQAAAAQVAAYLVALVASIQGRPAAELDACAPLAGSMDSLMLVELLTAVDNDAGLRLSMEDLFDVDDVAGLAGLIADRLREREPEPAAPARPAARPAAPRAPQPLPQLRTGRLKPMSVDEMAAYAELDGSITASAEPLPPEAAPKATFLTGATGFVGAFLLEQTLARTDGEVYCLVRARDEKTAMGRILDNLAGYGIDVSEHRGRIVAVPGDLARPGLGLDEECAAMLYARCGSIQHCGGVVKWTYPYKTLAPANVDGTREILRLAVRGGTPRPVHFISTVGVFSSAEFGQDRVAEDQPLETSGPLVVGYAQSKWVAERMMHTAHERGIPTTIHRINTGAHSVTGAFNRLDHLNIMVKGCVEAGIAPESLNVQLQPAPIDYVAAAVVEAAARPALHGRTFHLVNDAAMGWPEFFNTVSDFGYPLELVPFDTWRARITGADAGTMALLGLVPFLVDAVDDVRVPLSQTLATREALADTGLACPPLDRDLIHTYLRRFAAARFIEPPKGIRLADTAV